MTELADQGDLWHYMKRSGSRFPERRALREFVGLLRVLDRLHAQAAMHRDVTPLNVFVCADHHLRLGDFGIVKQGRGRGRVGTSRFAPWFVPPEVRGRDEPHWLSADDVFQVGQVLAMMISGQTERPLKVTEVSRLECADETKEIIQRCIAPRHNRFQTAREVIDAIRHGFTPLPRRHVSTIAGKNVVITGQLSILRREAVRLLTRAGAWVQRSVSKTTRVLLRGERVPAQLAGGVGGRKVLDARAARARGHQIIELRERDMRRLVKGWPAA